MARLCERPGCSEPGAAAYGMQPEDLLFWLSPLDRWNEFANGVLCKRHADSMVVPRGWTLDDRREPVPRLFRPPEVPPRAAGEGGSPPRRRRPTAATSENQQLDFGPENEPVEPAVEPVEPAVEPVEPAVEPVEPAVEPVEPVEPCWAPTFDTDDDLDGLLEVRSPLLARAFRGQDRPPRRRPT